MTERRLEPSLCLNQISTLGVKKMVKAISNTCTTDFQLVSIGIKLANKIVALMECNPEFENSTHFARAAELAHQWNEVFITGYVMQKGGKVNGL